MTIDPLRDHPQLLDAVVRLVHGEFWADRADGLSEAYLRAAFGGEMPGRVLASLVALEGDTLLGCIHLIDNDDASLPELHPWLAALVVLPDRRNEGIGSTLVRALADEARARGFKRLWFGTDGPGFYERIGARRHLDKGGGFWIMELPLVAPQSVAASRVP